jgi:type I restriction enzyme S subunit
MSTPWPEVPFEDLLLETKDGEWGDASSGIGLREVLIIRGTDFEDLNNPSAEFPRRWVKDHLIERKQLQAGDIILETAGGTSSQSTGRSVLLKASFFDQHPELPVMCASFSRHLRIKQEHYDSRFISYLLQGLYRFGYMGVFNLQHTGVARFQFTDFKNHTKLRIPKYPAQRTIAAVLAAYDDLIEANRRRIALLERMAEELYREWFVRLRFPGHKKIKITKGLPAGWRYEKLPVTADITYGFPFDGSRFNSVGLGKPIIRIRNIPDSATTDFTDEEAGEKYLVQRGDLLIGMDGEFHMNRWHSHEAYLVQRVCRLKAKIPLLEGYLGHAVRAPIKHYESILMGATVGHLGAMHLKAIDILMPPDDWLGNLEIFNVLSKQVGLLSQATAHIQRTRDLLLPRLISGKLSIGDLPIAFPPSMAELV